MQSISQECLTLTSHLLTLQQDHQEATGDFTLLLTSVQSACKYISSKVRSSGIAGFHGFAESSNESGETQKKLDIVANEVFLNVLSKSGKCCILASEEDKNAVLLQSSKGEYMVAFDPLDGSSNIEVNISIGSIFTIFKRKDISKELSESDILLDGSNIIAAGYCLYGSSTLMVLSIGNHQVNGYTLDPSLGEFILTHPNIKIPEKGSIYSINEGNASIWNNGITEYIKEKKFPSEGKKAYSLRYVGSMVADVHRTLIVGGIFLYPDDKKNLKGKLRVLYECFPMSFIMEHAGGKSTTGKGRVLDIQPTNIHERCSIIIGSKKDVEDVEECYKKHN